MSNSETELRRRVLEAAIIWQECRDRINGLHPDDGDYDEAARDFAEAECALALSVRLWKRAGQTQTKGKENAGR